MPTSRRDCGGVRILDFAVGDAVVSKDPRKAKGEVIEVVRFADEHDNLLIRFADGETCWQDGFWFRKL